MTTTDQPTADAAAAPTRPPRFAGLDLSLTSTGIALINDGDVIVETARPPTRIGAGHQRLRWLRIVIRDMIPTDTIVAVEGPAYSPAAQRGHHEMAGLWWLVTHMLWRRQTPYAVITPQHVKRYATGKGNAPKDQVLAAVIRRYPTVLVDGNDQADALVLAAMIADHYGHPIATVPQANRAALATVKTWPPITRSTDA